MENRFSLLETFQAQIEEILRNIEPALENVFFKKTVYIKISAM